MEKNNILKKIKIAVILFFCGLLIYLVLIPDISKLKNENPKKTSFMEYREIEWKNQRKKNKIQQIWVPYSKISLNIKRAVIIAEDDKFWNHDGFDYEAIQIAIEKNLKEKKFKVGGSTITQQLAKNLYLSPSKNPIRKLKEAIITWKIEKELNKRRILELYLNVAEWGEGIFGIEAASRYYFGKSASSLTVDEACRLASVLPNPRRFNPIGNSRYVTRRSSLIYKIMIKRGIVMPELKVSNVEFKS